MAKSIEGVRSVTGRNVSIAATGVREVNLNYSQSDLDTLSEIKAERERRERTPDKIVIEKNIAGPDSLTGGNHIMVLWGKQGVLDNLDQVQGLSDLAKPNFENPVDLIRNSDSFVDILYDNVPIVQHLADCNELHAGATKISFSGKNFDPSKLSVVDYSRPDATEKLDVMIIVPREKTHIELTASLIAPEESEEIHFEPNLLAATALVAVGVAAVVAAYPSGKAV